MHVGDVICKKMPYGGTNSVILDQLISNVCNSFKTAQGATKMFAVDAHERQIAKGLIRRLGILCSFEQDLQYLCPSIEHLLQMTSKRI